MAIHPARKALGCESCRNHLAIDGTNYCKYIATDPVVGDLYCSYDPYIHPTKISCEDCEDCWDGYAKENGFCEFLRIDETGAFCTCYCQELEVS